MLDVIEVFVVGLSGVFIGMAALYIAIRMTGWAADKLSGGDGHDK